jgi:hypothetical protein
MAEFVREKLIGTDGVCIATFRKSLHGADKIVV